MPEEKPAIVDAAEEFVEELKRGGKAYKLYWILRKDNSLHVYALPEGFKIGETVVNRTNILKLEDKINNHRKWADIRDETEQIDRVMREAIIRKFMDELRGINPKKSDSRSFYEIRGALDRSTGSLIGTKLLSTIVIKPVNLSQQNQPEEVRNIQELFRQKSREDPDFDEHAKDFGHTRESILPRLFDFHKQEYFNAVRHLSGRMKNRIIRE